MKKLDEHELITSIFKNHGKGKLWGVHFDLTNEMLNERWRTTYSPEIAAEVYEGDWEIGPLLWFNRFGEFEQNLSYQPDAYLYDGDEVRIERIASDPLDKLNISDVESDIKLAYLVIKRGSELIKIKKPIVYMIKDSIKIIQMSMLEKDTIENFITERIDLILLNNMNINEIIEINQIKSDAWHAVSLLKQSKFRNIEIINEVARDMLLFGYRLAEMEYRLKIRPVAKKALNSQHGAVKAGTISGARRREKAATTWQPHALILAKEQRELNPNLSQDDLAHEIRESWKLYSIKAPGTETLKKFISKMERDRRLKKRAI